eukprot:548110-Pyramimonas_sp.AAC.1
MSSLTCATLSSSFRWTAGGGAPPMPSEGVSEMCASKSQGMMVGGHAVASARSMSHQLAGRLGS